MKKVTAFVTVLAITVFIMPLGIFIKKNQEAVACGGYRPFHQCSMVIEAQPAQDTGVKLINPGTPQQSKTPAQAPGAHWLISTDSAAAAEPETIFTHLHKMPMQSGHYPRLEHPPRYSFLAQP